jgi:hypothetical protein
MIVTDVILVENPVFDQIRIILLRDENIIMRCQKFSIFLMATIHGYSRTYM